jgi:hypothetical protein
MADINMQDWAQRAQQQINNLHARLDGVLDRGLGHMQAAERHLNGFTLEPSAEDRIAAFYGGLNAMMEDRWEYSDAQELAMLNDRLDDLQQDQEPDQDHTRSRGQEMEH